MNNKRIISIMAAVIIGIVATIFISTSVSKAKKVNELTDLGNKYVLDQEYKQAITVFEKAIAIKDRKIENYIKLVKAYEAGGEYQGLINFYTNSITNSDLKKADKELLKLNFDQLITKIEISDTNIEVLKNQYLTLPESVTGVIENVKVDLPVKWGNTEIDSSEIKKVDVKGNVINASKDIVATVSVISKPGNDISNLLTESKLVYDDKNTVYYEDPFDRLIKKYNMDDSSIEVLNMPQEENPTGYRKLNLYKENLYLFRNSDTTFYKFDLKKSKLKAVKSFKPEDTVSSMRIIDNFLYYLIGVDKVDSKKETEETYFYAMQDTVYDVHSINLDTLEEKLVTQVIGDDLYFDDDGSIIGDNNNDKLLKYDINDNYKSIEVTINGIYGIKMITDKYIYLGYMDKYIGANSGKIYVGRVNRNDLSDFESLGITSTSISSDTLYELNDILYSHQNVRMGRVDSFEEYMYENGTRTEIYRFDNRYGGFPIAKVGDKLFYFNKQEEIVIPF